MTGGMAYVYDRGGLAGAMMNLESIVTGPVSHPHWEAQLKGLVERHAAETGSLKARAILSDWAGERGSFLQICPKEMLSRIPHPLVSEAQAVPAE
jgi:glutamate synthase (NADPH/NADH) large chain/glutamate synthase (ferredoxin)